MAGGRLQTAFVLSVLSLVALGTLLDGTKANAGLYVFEAFALVLLTGLAIALLELHEMRDARAGPFTAVLFALALANGALLLGMTGLSLALIVLLLFSLLGMLMGLMPSLPEPFVEKQAAKKGKAGKAVAQRKSKPGPRISKARKKRKR